MTAYKDLMRESIESIMSEINTDKESQDRSSKIIYKGMSIGNIIAAILSWELNRSILWCVLHTILGWFYVGYWYYNEYFKSSQF